MRPRLHERIALSCSSPSLAFFKPTLLGNEDWKDCKIIWECDLSRDTSPRARQSLPTSLKSCPARPRDLDFFSLKRSKLGIECEET